MDSLTRFIQSIAFDIVGLAFAAVAVYGLITSRIDAQAQLTAQSLAALYLGIKLPTTPASPAPPAAQG